MSGFANLVTAWFRDPPRSCRQGNSPPDAASPVAAAVRDAPCRARLKAVEALADENVDRDAAILGLAF